MSTSVHTFQGEMDKAGKVLTFSGDMFCPMRGKVIDYRAELEIVSNEKNIYRMFQKDDAGKEYKAGEITYTRAN